MIVFVAGVLLLVSALQTANCGDACQTPGCAETVARVTKSMNIDPCDDFFEFACRGWITKNPIPPNHHKVDTFQLIQEEIEIKLHNILNTTDNDKDGNPIKLARAMYRTCMDIDSYNKLGLKPFHDMLMKLGLPQGPPTDEEAKSLDIPKIVASAIKLYGINVFLLVMVGQYSPDSPTNQLVIEQTSPASQNFDVFLRQPEIFHAIIAAHRKNVKILFNLGGAGAKSEEYTTEHMEFMTKMAKIMGTPAERASKNYSRIVVTLDKVQEITDPHCDSWNWTTVFNTIFEGTDINVDPKSDTVVLNDALYFVNLPRLVKETPPGVLARYVYGKLFYMYWEIVVGSTLKLARWQACTRIVNAHFELALTAAYVEKHFDVKYNQKVMDMWTDMSASANEIITELDWMDPETKAHAHKKLNAVRPFIGYPEVITNQEELNKFYDGINVLDGKLFETYIQYYTVTSKRLLQTWRQAPDKNKWPIPGTAVNVLYMPQLNAVAITAGILHVPVYGNEVESLNYGALGSIIGSKLIESVESIDRPTDENGKSLQWWSAETIKSYLEKIRCMLTQFAKLVIPELGNNVKLNGHQIYHTSIADIAGLKIAFRAYEKFRAKSQPQQVLPVLDKYTDEQLFFLGYAQTFCGSETDVGLKKLIQASPYAPTHYRIIGALRNSDEFAKAWNCSLGSPMNPGNTCKIW